MENTFDSYNQKRVSFIIQTKNHAQFLGQILDLCRRLKKENDELIVVDGNSADNTKEIAGQYQDIIDIFISEPDINGHEAFNKSVLLARGKYIKQLGDDDVYYPDAMEKAIAVMEQNPDIDILLCGGTKEIGSRVRTVYLRPGINYGKQPEDVFRYLGPASGTGHLWRRRAIAKAGLFPLDNINGDAASVIAAIHNGCKVRFCRINLYRHIVYAHSVTAIKRRAHMFDSYRLVWRYCSLSFSIFYILRSEFYENPILQKIRNGARRFRRFLGKVIRGGEAIKSKRVKEYVWDGGLS